MSMSIKSCNWTVAMPFHYIPVWGRALQRCYANPFAHVLNLAREIGLPRISI